MSSYNKLFIGISVAVALFLFGIGIIIGHFAINSTDSTAEYYKKLVEDDDLKFLNELTKQINIENMKKHLKYFTSIPHMGGTPGDKISADYVYNELKNQGLDNVEITDYDVLLNFPDEKTPNSIEIKNSADQREELYKIEEITYDDDLDYSKIPKPFLAYAKAGSVTSDEVIYANYGMEEDFRHLLDKGIDVNGKIVLIRYGRIFRGNKIQFAEQFGAKGAIVFDDPMRAAPTATKDLVYPNGEFLPKEGAQRGSIILIDGDPLTPNYPANDYAYRLKIDDLKDDIPNIPSQVVGYEIALEIFKLLDANTAVTDNSWKGELNVTYTYGGKLKDGRKLTLNVLNNLRVERTYNVMGLIKGSVEPDRYVIIGNHRDAWTFGALDPNSGSSVLLEISRSLMELKKTKKWTPKRSILFMSWGSEEFGLIGSVEWVEEFQKKLSNNGVVYFNLDTIVKGDYAYKAMSSPLLYDYLFDVTKSIKQTSTETVYDRWLKNYPNTEKTLPRINPYLGATSDHMSFLQKAGMPTVDQGFVRDSKDPNFQNLALDSYPTYHSSYETYNLVIKYIDPNFTAFRMMGIIVGELARRMASTLILPFSVTTYGKELEKEIISFENTYRNDLAEMKVDLNSLKAAIYNFSSVANDFDRRIKSIDKTEYHQVRIYNDQLRNVERAFLDPSGLERNGYLHMVFSPSVVDSSGGDSFPSITDAIYSYKRATQNKDQIVEKIKKQISIVTYAVHSASSILKEPNDFTRYKY